MDDLLFVVVLSVSLYVFFLLYVKGKNWRCGKDGVPPGSLGLPLFGETLKLISAYKTSNPEPFIDERRARYGNLFTTHVFGEATIFSTNAEVNRFILQNEGKLFMGDYPSSISNLLGRHSLVLMKGSLHKRMHSLTMSFANSSIIKDHLFFHIQRLVRLNLDSWGDAVLLQDETKKITFDIAVKQMISLEPGEWTEKLRKEYLLLIEGFFSLPVPLFFTTYARALKARSRAGDALRATVKQRRAWREEEEEGDGQKGRKDLMEALLREGLSDEEIVDFLLALLVAGYETTSTIMTLAVKFISQNPRALSQLKEEHQEIRRRRRDSEALAWSDYKSMPFTQCVINETLRVTNIIGGVFRRAVSDVHVKGYTIPKGWKVFASFRAVHLDHQLYEDARTFNPWRWQGDNKGSQSGIFTPLVGDLVSAQVTSLPGSRSPSSFITSSPLSDPAYRRETGRLVTNTGKMGGGCSASIYMLLIDSWEEAEEDRLVFFPTTRTLKRYPIKVNRRNSQLS